MAQSEKVALDKNSPLPLYYQLKEAIMQRLAAKEWRPGCKIPTEGELCQMYGVSRITIRKALEELQQEGYLEKIQGRGTFVKNVTIEQKLSKFYSFSEELRKNGIRERAQVMEFSVQTPVPEVAAALRIKPEEKVFQISRIRLADETPYAYEISSIPCYLAAGLTAEMVQNVGLYRSLAAQGVTVNSAVETLLAVKLKADVAKQLGVSEGDAAIRLLRTASSGPAVVEYCDSTVVGNFFSYTVELK